MTCKVKEEVLKKRLEQRFEELSEKYGIKITEGEKVPLLEGLQTDLDFLGQELGADTYREGDKVGNKIVSLEILNNPLAIGLDSLGQAVKGEETEFSKADGDRANYQRLTVDFMSKQFDEKKSRLRDWAMEASIKIGQNLNAQATKKGADPRTIDRLYAIRTKLLEAVTKESAFEERVIAFLDYLTEVNILTGNVLDTLVEMKGDEQRAYKMTEIIPIVAGHEEMVNKIHKELVGVPDNPLKENLKETLDNLKGIKEIGDVYYEDLATMDLAAILQPSLNEMKAKRDRDIATLEATRKVQMDQVASPALKEKLSNIIQAKIDKVNEEYNQFAPDLKNIADTLKGKKGDVTLTSSYLRAMITNPDFVVSGMAQMFRKMTYKARIETQNIENLYEEKLQEYLKKNGMTSANNQKFFKDFIEEREIYKVIDGKVESTKALQIKNYYDPKRYTQISLLDSVIKLVTDSIRDETPLDLNFNWDIAGNVGINDIIGQYDLTNMSEKDLIGLEYNLRSAKIKWQKANLVDKYVEEYYEADKLLDTFVWTKDGEVFEGDVLPKDFDEFYNLRDRYGLYNKELNDLRWEIRRNNNIPLPSHIERKQFYLDEKVKLRDEKAWDTPLEKKAAEILLKYKTLKRQYGSYKVSEASLASWERDKNKVDSTFTEEDRKAWYEANVKREFSDTFLKRVKEISDSISVIQDSVRQARGLEKDDTIKDLWGELRSLVESKRDNSRVIDGNKFKDEELERVKAIEDKINEFGKEVQDLFKGKYVEGVFQGMTKGEKLELQRIRSRIGEAIAEVIQRSKDAKLNKRKDDQIDLLNIEIEDLKDRKKALTSEYEVDQRFEDEHKAINKLYQELAEIRKGDSTKYFKERMSRELGAYIQDKPRPNIPFDQWDSYYRDMFKKDPNSWYSKNTFEKFEYAKQDKVIKTKGGEKTITEWVETSKRSPYYIWREIEPTDKEDIIDERPTFAWANYKVDSQYETNDSLDIRGKLKLKDFGRDLGLNDAQKEFLNFMREDFYSRQEVYADNLKMGDLLPTIERELSIFETTEDSSKTLGEQLLRKVSNTAQEVDEGTGDTSGKQMMSVPIYFRGELDPAIQSKNLYKLLIKYGQRSVHYDLIQKDILPSYTAITKTLENNNPLTVKDDRFIMNELKNVGDKVASQLGNRTKLYEKNKVNNRLNVVNQIQDMWVHGEENVATKEIKVLGRQVRGDKINRLLLGTKSMLTIGSIPLISGYPLAAQAGNWLAGQISQLVKTGIKNRAIRYSVKDNAKAFKTFQTKYATSLLTDYSESKIGLKSFFGQLTDRFGVFDQVGQEVGEGLKYRYKQNRARRFSDLFFFSKNIVENTLASTIFITIAENHYIKDVEGNLIGGKPINVLEAFELSPATKRLTLKYEWSEEDQLRFINKFEKAKRDADGAYSALDKSLTERLWYGASLFWMNKWVVPRFDNMFSSKRFSLEEGTHISGYLTDSAYTMVEVFKYLRDSDTRNYNFIKSALTPDQKDNLRQTRNQFIMLTMLSIAGKYLLGYDDEDEDRFKKMKKQSAMYNWALYSLLKGKAEAESLFIPYGVEELHRKLENPIPQLIPFFGDVYKIAWRDVNYDKIYNPFNWMDEEIDFLKAYKVDSGYAEKGDTKALIDFFKMMGWTNSKSDAERGVKAIESFSK